MDIVVYFCVNCLCSDNWESPVIVVWGVNVCSAVGRIQSHARDHFLL